jgi:hypothetical protein
MLGRNDEGRSRDEGQVINTWIFRDHPDPIYPPLNFILMEPGFNTVEKICGRFDFGICQIGYDGGKLYRSEDYLHDQELRTFTIVDERTGHKLERTYERYDRLVERYPGWRLVDPWKLARRFAGVDEEETQEKTQEAEIDF